MTELPNLLRFFANVNVDEPPQQFANLHGEGNGWEEAWISAASSVVDKPTIIIRGQKDNVVAAVAAYGGGGSIGKRGKGVIPLRVPPASNRAWDDSPIPLTNRQKEIPQIPSRSPRAPARQKQSKIRFRSRPAAATVVSTELHQKQHVEVPATNFDSPALLWSKRFGGGGGGGGGKETNTKIMCCDKEGSSSSAPVGLGIDIINLTNQIVNSVVDRFSLNLIESIEIARAHRKLLLTEPESGENAVIIEDTQPIITSILESFGSSNSVKSNNDGNDDTSSYKFSESARNFRDAIAVLTSLPNIRPTDQLVTVILWLLSTDIHKDLSLEKKQIKDFNDLSLIGFSKMIEEITSIVSSKSEVADDSQQKQMRRWHTEIIQSFADEGKFGESVKNQKSPKDVSHSPKSVVSSPNKVVTSSSPPIFSELLLEHVLPH